jgi:hypothetical protein
MATGWQPERLYSSLFLLGIFIILATLPEIQAFHTSQRSAQIHILQLFIVLSMAVRAVGGAVESGASARTGAAK